MTGVFCALSRKFPNTSIRTFSCCKDKLISCGLIKIQNSHSYSIIRDSSTRYHVERTSRRYLCQIHKPHGRRYLKRRLWTHSLNNQEKDQHADAQSQNYTHFGYDKVLVNEKVERVRDVFENVANSYDVMNDVMSAGTHRLWKHHFVNQLNLSRGMKILDMAGGTGDIAFKMLDNIIDSSTRHEHNNTDTDIIISDINENMLDVGQKRAARLGIKERFQWVQADAENLPFDDESFDLYTIAFGIRNTTHIDKVLEEAHRVLKFGGRFSCLEFSHVENSLLKSLYDMYSFQVIPVLGQVFASDWNSYQYLVESIRQFPKQDDFADLIYDAGFTNVMYENLTFGVVTIHDGFKI